MTLPIATSVTAVDTKLSTVYSANNLMTFFMDVCSNKIPLECGGYFSNSPDFKVFEEGVIKNVRADVQKQDAPFFYFTKTSNFERVSKFFIPYSKSKIFRVPKYRPITKKEEFPKKVGEIIVYRTKKSPSMCHEVIVTRIYFDDKNIIHTVNLGSTSYSTKLLFDNYEWYSDVEKTWLPFGIKISESND